MALKAECTFVIYAARFGVKVQVTEAFTADRAAGLDYPTLGPPTFEGKVPGALITPAKIGLLPLPDGGQIDQDVAGVTITITDKELSTSIRTGALDYRQPVPAR
jgi:hypothetical protein